MAALAIKCYSPDLQTHALTTPIPQDTTSWKAIMVVGCLILGIAACFYFGRGGGGGGGNSSASEGFKPGEFPPPPPPPPMAPPVRSSQKLGDEVTRLGYFMRRGQQDLDSLYNQVLLLNLKVSKLTQFYNFVTKPQHPPASGSVVLVPPASGSVVSVPPASGSGDIGGII